METHFEKIHASSAVSDYSSVLIFYQKRGFIVSETESCEGVCSKFLTTQVIRIFWKTNQVNVAGHFDQFA